MSTKAIWTKCAPQSEFTTDMRGCDFVLHFSEIFVVRVLIKYGVHWSCLHWVFNGEILIMMRYPFTSKLQLTVRVFTPTIQLLSVNVAAQILLTAIFYHDQVHC